MRVVLNIFLYLKKGKEICRWIVRCERKSIVKYYLFLKLC